MPEKPIPSDESFIPALVQMVLGEDIFFEVANSIELGPFDSTQGGYHRLGCLTAREEGFWALARIREELRQYWTSPTVVRTSSWLSQADALASLYEAIDEADYYGISDRIRLTQRLVASALTEFLADEESSASCPKVFLDHRAFCLYLRSDAAIAEFLDLTYGLKGEMTIEREITLALTWCCEQLRAFWNVPVVARSLQWLTHSNNILSVLGKSEHCVNVESPQRISFILCLVATCVERTEF